jgi:hypothetical protein
VNEPAQSEGPRPSVLAIGVTALQAVQAQRAVLDVLPEADLLAPDDEATREQYSNFTQSFRFVELDPRDPIEAQLLASYLTYKRQVEELLGRWGAGTSNFVDPFSAIVVALAQASADGAAEPLEGRGPWRRLRGVLQGRAGGEAPSARSSVLARLLTGLGYAYGGGFPGPVLLELIDARVTLVGEPGLPDEALALAQELVARGASEDFHLPLRWDGGLGRWAPLPEGWSDQAHLRRLATEIQAKLPPPEGDVR